MKRLNFKNQVLLCWSFLLLAIYLPFSAFATTCAEATNVPSVPYTAMVTCTGTNDVNAGNVTNFCGLSTLYLGGDEALLTLTPDESGFYEISITGQSWTSLVVFDGCPTTGANCIDGVANSATSKTIAVDLEEGVEYFILVDTWPAPQSPCLGAGTEISISFLGSGFYCFGGPTSNAFTQLEGVELQGSTESIDWSWTCPGVIGGIDATNEVAQLIQGVTYDLNNLYGSCSGSWSAVASAWIDWDQSISYEPSELIGDWSGTVVPGGTAVTHTFTVPADAAVGLTQMRVVLVEVGTLPLDPCASYTWGTTVDFTIEILEAVDCELSNCPSSVVVSNSPGQCGAFLNFPVPNTVGDCPGAAINDYNGGVNASDFYPVGTTEVTFFVPGTGASCSFTVTVNDDEPPTLGCPSDIIITLGGGECDRIVSFDVDLTDNCPFIEPGNIIFTETAGTPGNFFNSFAGVTFDIENVSAGPITIDGFNVPVTPANANVNFDVYYTTTATTNVGVQTNPAEWTLMGSATVTSNGAVAWNPATFTNVPIGGLTLAPGESKGFYVFLSNYPAGTYHYTNGSFTANNGDIEVRSNGFGSNATPFGNTFASRAFVGEVIYSAAGGPSDVTQTSGLPSGSTFQIGTTTNCFEGEDAVGNVGECCFDVVINPFPNPVTALACNDLVRISVDPDCEAHINADMILEGGPYRCYDDYEIIIETQGGVTVPNPITGEFVGELLMVTIIDPVTGNSCWSNLLIEDKLIPDLICDVYTVDCLADLNPDASASIESIVLTASLDTNTITFGQAVACPGGDYAYLRVLDLQALGISGNFEPQLFRMGVESSAGGINATLRFYVFNDPSSYNPGATGFSYADLTQVGADNTGTIPALNLDFWDMPISDVVIPGGTQYLVWELEVPGGNFVSFVMGSNIGGETSPSYIASEFCGLPNPETLASIGFTGNWLSIVYGEAATGGIPFPLPEGVAVTPPTGAGPFTVSGFDSCGDVILSYEDSVQEFPSCDGEFQKIITRSWVAQDIGGNTSSCAQTIRVRRGDLANVDIPENFTLDCSDNFPVDDNGNPHPSLTGGLDIESCKDLAATYTDTRIPDCGGGYKVIRNWIILDWCSGEVLRGAQVIKVMDGNAPEFDPACETPRTVNTDINQCSRALYFVPVPSITDVCSEVVSYTVSSTAGNVGQDNQGNWIIENLPVGTHVVTYTANDGCDNVATCSFELNVVDNVAPVAICDIDTRVSLGSDGNALVHWTAFDDGSYDNCGIAEIGLQRDLSNPGGRAGCGNSPGANVWVPQLNFCCDDLTRSPILVNVRVVDVNGNSNTCQVEVYVEDRLAPVVSCPDPIEVDLNCLYNFGDVVWAEAIGNDNAVNVSADALNNIALFGEQFGRIARTQSPFNEEFRSFEINPTGNPNSQVRIGINDGYAVDNCPTSGAGLRVFETYRITVDPMCGNVGTSVSQLNPFKGNLAIERNFYVVDGQGNGQAAPNAGFGNPNTATCTQRIYVTNNNPFQGLTRMQWENNAIGQANIVRTISECGGNDPDLNEVGEIDKARILNYINNRADAACANLLVGYTDMEFQIVNDACFKVLRQWKVIDWCQHDPNSGAGEWTYIQEIRVMDTAGPECDGCSERDFEITDGVDCAGFVDFEVEFFDGCTPDDQLHIRFQVDAFNTGSFDIDQSWTGAANAVNANRVLPFGDHRVRWTVSDMCGNVSIFEYEFSVVDAKKPTPVCLNGIATVVMPATIPPMITLSADHFDAGSFDDCTDSDNLIFSYTSDTDDTHWTWTCDDLDGEQIVTFPVNIWVTDEAGNQDFCVTYIEIQDNMNVCPADTAGGSATIAGVIVNEENEGVDNVDITLLGINSGISAGFNTGVDGSFNFANVPMGQEYHLQGSRNDNPLNGVTTYDIALIQRHILGSQLLDSPYKLIAADVNNDGNINVIDVAQLRRLILGTYTEFPNSESWKIIVDEPLETGITPPSHNTVMDLGLVNRDMWDNNFIGIKMGDVNASHNANGLISASERTSGESLQFVAQDVNLTSGEQVVVEITSGNIEGVFGYQGTINFDRNALEFVGFESGLIELSDANFGFHLLSEGMITTSWSETTGIENGNGVLFSLVFEARSEGTLSQALSIGSNRTVAESYNDNGVMGVEMVFESGAVRADNFTLYQNTPNPFNGETVIGFVLPEATEATITIFDVTGKVVRVIEGNYAAGYNEETVSRSELGAAGVYYYQLDTENHTATKKMIFMD